MAGIGRTDIVCLDDEFVFELNRRRIEKGISLSRMAMDMKLTYPTVMKVFGTGERNVARATKERIENYALGLGVDAELYREIL